MAAKKHSQNNLSAKLVKKKHEKSENTSSKAFFSIEGINSWFLIIPLSAVFLGILIFNAIDYLPFIEDDALISLRYAMRLLEGEGLTWTDGERVEGYSNLLWVLAVAFVSFFGSEPIDSARILGFTLMSGSLTAIIYYFLRKVSYSNLIAAIVGGLLFTFSGSFAVWVVGGLEQPLLAFLLAWGLVTYLISMENEVLKIRDYFIPGLFFGLIVITRPDGIIFPSVLIFVYVASKKFKRIDLMKSLKFFSFPLGFYVLQLIFRLSYYGEWVPNTALVKVTLSSSHILHGLEYVFDGIINLFPLFLLLAISIILLIKQKKFFPEAAMLLFTIIVWIIYIILVGGDIFPGRRHFVPVILISIYIISLAISNHKRIKDSIMFSPLLLVLPFVAAYAYMQYNDKENIKAKEEKWEYEGKAIGLLLKKAFFQEKPLVAVTSAGCIPYWSELPSLDMLGLNDYYLPRNPPENFGKEWIAHELGSADYVMKRKPDIVIFNMANSGKSANLSAEISLYNHPDFKKKYGGMMVFCTEPHKTDIMVFFRKDSKKIGIRRYGDTLFIPGYLIGNNPEKTISMLDNQGNLACLVNKENPAYLYNLPVEAGRWQLEVLTDNPSVFVAVRDGETEIGRGNASIIFNYYDGIGMNFGIWGTGKEPEMIRGVRMIKQNH